MNFGGYQGPLAPAAQNGIDLFRGEWSSKFPESYGVDSGGWAGLFVDERITWALVGLASHGRSIVDAHVLELGPSEAGHTTMLEQAGAASVTAIEANGRAYLKCLIVKELTRLKRSRFLLGDALRELETSDRRYDIGVASGVLYHQREPVRLLKLLTQKCRHLYLWTHYHDPRDLASRPQLAARFDRAMEQEVAGFRHAVHPYRYEEGMAWRGFSGGSNQRCAWLSRHDILAALRYFGFSKIITREEPNPHGSSMSIVASPV